MSKKIKIGVSGEKGSFSEEAAVFYIRQNKIKNYELAYLVDMENVLRALDEKKISLGIFPLVNSRGGVVEQAVVAMGRYNFKVKNIFSILIRHCILIPKGMKQENIQEIFSHQQALRQCAMYLKKNFKKARICEYADTAKAAADLFLGRLGEKAAVIAPKICAELYNLEVLKENIQDVKDNYTTFLVVRK